MRPEPRQAERGAALLTVLMLVAVIAVIAAGALERLTLTTRLAANAAAGQAAEGYARAAETLALTRVDTLLGQGRSRVTLAGGWSGRPFGLPLPGGGVAVARITDGGNCFNLNSLVSSGEAGTYTSYGPAREQFARLMRLIGIAPHLAEQVAAGAADWIDTDADQQANGGEDATYLSLATPYRTGGTLMADRSELRAVAGVTPDLFRQLQPWICTLPRAEATRINVDTLLPEQAPLLAMQYPDSMPVDLARQLLLRRPPQGWADIGAFQNQANQAGVVAGLNSTGPLAVTTSWFALTIDVTVPGAERHERALVDANRLPAQLVSRQWGEGT
ncbi:type II secretion system minor pseudopilin GspK [Sphingomonas aerophila]|uniref:Type II secretion system protein K n=1 Tax=Sphingomonas aerophila TaxID=1344948 RepID=A0A7W9EW78_9SPHN|nr:type II secretion system minor pseudopilin GspK [Sphingomonas aerophila]MBB5715447.1 general secretion pathway protein K [Sphingomonas aerophila]